VVVAVGLERVGEICGVLQKLRCETVCELFLFPLPDLRRASLWFFFFMAIIKISLARKAMFFVCGLGAVAGCWLIFFQVATPVTLPRALSR
jgi:hypothetical protein